MNYKKFILVIAILFPSFLFTATSTNHIINLPLYSIIPFLGILLSIALFPIVNHSFWEKNFGKISAFWALLFLIPFSFTYGIEITTYELLHVILHEYMPFIILLLSLFVISGGICISGNLVGTPTFNISILIIGTILASWMGTTGASMLLIRPLINANKWRSNKIHIVVFFIFLVSNIGGSLTPLGDPPLFLGFLHGIDFFWTAKNLFGPMLMVSCILLIIYFIIDTYFYNLEIDKKPNITFSFKELKIDGKINFLLLFGVLCLVLMSGFTDMGQFKLFNIELHTQNILRDIMLLFLVYMSLLLTKKEVRKANGFTWFPIMEVGKLFLGIFITIIPAIAILKVGENGSLSSIINLTKDSAGNPNNMMYFWLTGILSSFLDNAPTYLVFFNTAGGNPIELMSNLNNTLLAISSGAVFMGALTYIGNAPNFMVRSIAEENGIKMPSFFGYMLWSIAILIPIFILISFIYY